MSPQWTEFLLCPICTQTFEETVRRPISLGCGHTVCKMCLNKLHRKACPFDQTAISTDIEQLPVNTALLQLVGGQVPKAQPVALITSPEDAQNYEVARQCVEELALYLKPLSNTRGVGLSSTAQSMLSRPMQRKLVTLVHCQLVEEEGRVRAMRAARSLGERTVTELILQHQNPQQLSSNLWAAVRARGCQFLGPAMQEEALKLVLLALEDGSALSRKVLVLFVVQRLEPRFPQASKTSIGHVVQLLYRASCFKVTKRDEDSSLMQLKEEFRTYEALRREHDSQIVQIAMEGGLRIAPDQWSSLLYGDQSHKSHMQSIIDKLQTPASFAQSVQELTIALQRTGDPANLNRLRPHLELLANIDPSPDAPPPTWEQLEKGLVAVKTVVHGLVDFIQHHSKKGADPQQPPQHSKYKTYMCRDMKQKGGCPRGASCTFAHSQEELEKYRKMNKRLATRPGVGVVFTDDGLTPDVAVTPKLSPVTNGSGAPNLPQLVARGTDTVPYELLSKPVKMDGGSPSVPGSPPDVLDSMPKSGIPLPPHAMVHPRLPSDHLSGVKHMSGVARGSPVYSQPQPRDVYDIRPPPASQYEPPQYPASYPYQQPTQYVSREYIRNPPPPSESGPPYHDPYTGYSAPERPYHSQHSGPPFPYTHYDRGHHGAYGAPPPPPQTYPTQRDSLVKMSPAPLDVPPPSAGQANSLYYQESSARDRYAPDGYYQTGSQPPPMRTYVRGSPYSSSQTTLDYLHRRRQELLSQLAERKVISPPPFAASPTLSHPFPNDYPTEYGDESSKTILKGREPDYAGQYSPWSCETIGSYISTKDAKPKNVMVPGAMEMMNVEDKGPREPSMEAPRRGTEVKDDDPIIPFGPQPTVSRFGAISRTSKTGYQTTGPVQAMASTSQNPNSKHMTMPDYSYGSHGGWGGASYPSHQIAPSSQGHFIERLPMTTPDREQLKIELQQVNQQITQQTQMHNIEAASNSLLLQRETSALVGQPLQPIQGQTAHSTQQPQPKWPAGGASVSAISNEQLSLELHQVEREIGKRTREMALENQITHDVQQYKMQPAENGQPEQETQLEEMSLALGDVSNGSSGLQESAVGGSMLSLTSKTAALSLCSDQVITGSEMQKNGVVHSCS
ncbi:roquin-1 isoform X2 [Girardinichthys multiradiatus]|uniref:roquin-1 isoform X2 n=1 Tax=Girardinichthys multiradiatus TaxID=208333 RepID=UPI001FAD4EAB|nr:roquin-1 isoform X2 [Girardinichthys multiradiatus]